MVRTHSRGGTIDGIRHADAHLTLQRLQPPSADTSPQWIGPRDPIPAGIPPDVATRPLRHSQQRRPATQYVAPPKARHVSRFRAIAVRLQTPGIIAGGLAVGLLAQSQLLGELAIAAYGTFAVLRRVSSRTTFRFALCMFIGIAVLLVIAGNDRLAANFAVYAFLLLGVGAITLGIELYRGETP